MIFSEFSKFNQNLEFTENLFSDFSRILTFRKNVKKVLLFRDVTKSVLFPPTDSYYFIINKNVSIIINR